jgi:DNA polymerase
MRHSLAKQVERHLTGFAKGDEVVKAMGKRRLDFTDEELARYGDYCILDCELTYKLFRHYMSNGFPKRELAVMDMTLKMFTNPVLELDLDRLETHLYNVKQRKAELLQSAGVDKKELMSNNKFADLLRAQGVEPPTKISLKTGKEAYAFAKTDDGFKELLDHEDDTVQVLANARLGNKSTLEETRTERFIGIAHRGLLPGPISYYAAHTGRWGGSDKINLQNLPSRGKNGKVLKRTIHAPEGYLCLVADSAQIEARIVAWLAGEHELVAAFDRGDDVYVTMASKIYNKPEAQISSSERVIGKMTILGCGYGMGAEKFSDQLRAQAGVHVTLDEAQTIVRTYRNTYRNIVKLWRQGGDAITALSRGDALPFGREGVLQVVPDREGILLPNGLVQFYPNLHVAEQTSKGPQFKYIGNKGHTRIYGGKLVENVCQGLAKIVIADQMLEVQKQYPVRLTVHDSIVLCIPDDIAMVEKAKMSVRNAMSRTPPWAEGLPLNCDLDVAKYYGDCDA